MMGQGGDSKASVRGAWRRFLPGALLLLGLAAFLAFGLGDYVSCAFLRDNHERLSGFIDDHKVVAALAFIVGYGLAVAFSLPVAVVLTLAGGFLFGLWQGTAYVVFAATLGAAALFLAARSALGQGLRGRAGPAVARMEQGFRNHAMSYLLFLRLTPIFPFWLVNLVAAVVGMPLRTFILATALGIAPASFIYVSVGNGLNALFDNAQVAAGAACDPRSMISAEVWLPLIGLAILSLVPVIYQKLRGQKPRGRQAPADKTEGRPHG